MDLEVQKLLEKADGNFAIFDSVAKAHSVLSRYDSMNLKCSKPFLMYSKTVTNIPECSENTFRNGRTKRKRGQNNGIY